MCGTVVPYCYDSTAVCNTAVCATAVCDTAVTYVCPGNLETAVTSMVTAPEGPAGEPMSIPGKQPGGWNQLSVKELYRRIDTIEYFSKMPRVNDSRHLAKLCKTGEPHSADVPVIVGSLTLSR